MEEARAEWLVVEAGDGVRAEGDVGEGEDGVDEEVGRAGEEEEARPAHGQGPVVEVEPRPRAEALAPDVEAAVAVEQAGARLAGDDGAEAKVEIRILRRFARRLRGGGHGRHSKGRRAEGAGRRWMSCRCTNPSHGRRPCIREDTTCPRLRALLPQTGRVCRRRLPRLSISWPAITASRTRRASSCRAGGIWSSSRMRSNNCRFLNASGSGASLPVASSSSETWNISAKRIAVSSDGTLCPFS